MPHELFKAFAVQLHLNHGSISSNELVHLLKEKEPVLASLILSYIQATEAHQFISKDHELRHKVKDIWQFQMTRTQQEVDQCKAKLMEYCFQHGLSLPQTDT